MDISVIIVNYNTAAMTLACIDSIYANTKGVSFEVIVIDNASTDESKELLGKDGRIRYVYSYENMGFGRANNVGMMLAKGKYFFLLNSDTLLKNDALNRFYNYAESHEKRAFYGCWLENADGKYVHSCSSRVDLCGLIKSSLNRYRKFFTGKKEVGSEWDIAYSEEERKEVNDVTGANLFLHRCVYEETGGFDHEYFLYYEETDWEMRGHALGIKSYCLNGPRIVHLEGGSQSSEGVNWKKLRIMYKSENRYARKHLPMWQYAIYKPFHIVTTGLPLRVIEILKRA